MDIHYWSVTLGRDQIKADKLKLNLDKSGNVLCCHLGIKAVLDGVTFPWKV